MVLRVGGGGEGDASEHLYVERVCAICIRRMSSPAMPGSSTPCPRLLKVPCAPK